MQLLAGRAGATKGSHVGGRVDVNGAPRDFSTFSKNAAYVQQVGCAVVLSIVMQHPSFLLLGAFCSFFWF